MSDEAREDACREYQSSLEDLTFNSKPHINMLTILAEENLQFTKDIVAIIEAQINKAPPAEKLPVLYLVDSIVKNVGGEYLEVFTKNLIPSFICVFEKVDENTRKCLFKLRSTWDEIFSLTKLYALDVRVNGVDPAWPVKPLPPTVNASIHVNPRFLKSTDEVAPPPKVSEKNLTEEQMIRQQLLAKQKQLLELQQKKIELELEQTKAQLVASTTPSAASVQAPFSSAPSFSQPTSMGHGRSWPPPQAEKHPTRDPRLNRGPSLTINPKEQAAKKENVANVAPFKKGPPPPTEKPKPMRIPKKENSVSEEKGKSKSQSPPIKSAPYRSKVFEPEHPKNLEISRKDPRLRKQVQDKTDSKEEEAKEKKRSSEKREREDAGKASEQQRSSSFREKLVNGSLNKHDRSETFQKAGIKVSKANIRKRSRSRSRSPPSHSPKRRRSPKRRTRSITPPFKSVKGRPPSKHNEDHTSQSNSRDDRNTPKKSLSEPRRLKRPLEDRPEQRDSQPTRTSGGEHKSVKEVKKWTSGSEENKPLKPSEQDFSHDKSRLQRQTNRHTDYQRMTPQRTPKQHRLSVDDNLHIPDLLNSASKKDLLRKAQQKVKNGKLSQEQFLKCAHQIRQLFQYQEERQRSDSWEESNDDPQNSISTAQQSYMEHKSRLIKTQLQRPVKHMSPLGEIVHRLRPHQESNQFEKSDVHRKSTEISMSSDSRRNDRPPSRTGPLFRNLPSPGSCERNSSSLPFEASPQAMDIDPLNDGEISPRFESPNSVHSGTGPDTDGQASSDVPLHHDIVSGPSRGGRNLLCESPGHTPPHFSEGSGSHMNMSRHEGPNIPPRFDGHTSSHAVFEEAHGHVGPTKMDGPARAQLPARFERNPGPVRFDGPGGHGPPRFDGPTRYDNHGTQRFERPPLLNAPVRFDNQPGPHGPVRFGEPRGVGRFEGPGSGPFEGPGSGPFEGPGSGSFEGPRGPNRFDCQGPMRFNNPMQPNRFDGPVRFENPNMGPGPMRFPSGMVNYEAPRRFEGPGGQGQGMMLFDNPARTGPVRFDAQPTGMPIFDPAPQGPPRFHGPPNMLNSFRPQGPMIDQNQDPGVLNPGVPPHNFNMAPSNVFENQPAPFHMQQNVPQAPNFNMPDPTPSGFQNSYVPVAQFQGAPAGNLPMGGMPGPIQNFIPQNPGPPILNPPNPQYIEPESHLGQMDVNDLMTKLMEFGIIKTPQTDSNSESAPASQSQSLPEDEEPEEEEEIDEYEQLPDMTGFNLEEMKQRHDCVVTKLYTGIQCYSCGMRFLASQTDIYADHLDWHYRQNRSEKDISRKITHRRWYYSLTDWIEFEEIADLEERAKSQFFEKVHEEVVQKTQEAAKEREFQSVKAAPDVVVEICEICQEKFEMYWEEDEEEWHLKNAIRVEGNTYHPSCYEDYKNTSSFVDSTPSPNKMLTENPLNIFLKQEQEGENSCCSIKEDAAEAMPDAITVKKEVQDNVEGDSQSSAIPF